MRHLFIIAVFASLLIGCRTQSQTTHSNTITNDSINTVINDSIKATANIDIKLNQVEDTKTIIKEDIKEVITDSINRTTTERVISRVIEQTTDISSTGDVVAQSDTISTKQSVINVVSDSKAIEDKQENSKSQNVMLYVFLSLLCVVALVVIFKFF